MIHMLTVVLIVPQKLDLPIFGLITPIQVLNTYLIAFLTDVTVHPYQM